MATRHAPTTPLPTAVRKSGFAALGLPDALVAALTALGITEPFPIQSATLPDSLAGRDLLGRGRTGSGKTYAFVLPMLARLAARPGKARPHRPRALILAPTRELVSQIEATLAPLAEALQLSTLTVFGGVRPQQQIRSLRRGVDIVIACPGRLEDHVRSGEADLGAVQVTVLDEADHMADLGFLPVVRRLLDGTPRDAQRLLFSATLDAGVDVLVKRYLTDPVTHSVDSAQSPVATMTHHVLHVAKESRLPVLVDLAAAPGRTVVFTRTKHGAKNLARQLVAQGVPAVELHGNLSQNARTRNLTAFSSGDATTLVATDIAARGIHVDDVGLVVHADPPVEHKAYLHRSGRTARAGSDGTVVTLMLDAQVSDVRDLTRKAGIKPAVARVDVTDPLLRQIAPGERTFVAPAARKVEPQRDASGASGGGDRRSRGRKPAAAGRGRGGAQAPASEHRSSRNRRRGGAGSTGGTGGTGGTGRPHSAAAFSSSRRGR
ncbi:MAG: DEAD/DEAH box helicase [Nocardioidaceae bacterium]